MKNLKNLNQYLSNLAILITKTHNIHWNVVGPQFMSIHNYTEELYDYYFDKYDSVAEILKMKGEMPLVKVADYLKNSTIKEIDGKDFKPSEALKLVKEDMEAMCELAKKIRAAADKEDDFAVVGEFEEHISHYVKQLWFLNSMLKDMK